MNSIDKKSISYNDVHIQLPVLLEKLLSAEKYPLRTLTRGKIEKILGSEDAVPGVYLMSDIEDDTPVYVGRSKTLAQRIGTDHRAIQKTQATLGLRLWKQDIEGILCMKTAREYMYRRFNVRMLPIENEYFRTIFEVYAAMNLCTEHNSFMEH
ncbi:MAG: hypothetical protein P0Y55_09950 [Candidatus Cohnella colombiensis]|uniref:GIY-YIG domain-containing protein n=1 Tax=Candidatus Cohnella colombiensis TaxID=3121368 RepID=A0AA95F1F8_9BACL|nr:MAG: hypothetical protein P0Y55_09950 [Cohnella sp.]